MERIYKATDADNERPDRQQLDAHFAYWNVSTLHASTSIDKKKAPSDTAVLDKSFLSGPFSFFSCKIQESWEEFSNTKEKLLQDRQGCW